MSLYSPISFLTVWVCVCARAHALVFRSIRVVLMLLSYKMLTKGGNDKAAWYVSVFWYITCVVHAYLLHITSHSTRTQCGRVEDGKVSSQGREWIRETMICILSSSWLLLKPDRWPWGSLCVSFYLCSQTWKKLYETSDKEHVGCTLQRPSCSLSRRRFHTVELRRALHGSMKSDIVSKLLLKFILVKVASNSFLHTIIVLRSLVKSSIRTGWNIRCTSSLN